MTRVDASEKQPPTVPLTEKIIPPGLTKQTWFLWLWTREESALSLGPAELLLGDIGEASFSCPRSLHL